ncbi:uncharacterized protein PAC_19454 [Phialocephala subalpina]|uniref:Uncharacterized protein n=1 Tax=Phialocephala subalpina TaxID=576137 RepID=A0A1L7XWY6_9HELO|nr:uncharacterized protein PAC_19454 [Phialocephala subalpina]
MPGHVKTPNHSYYETPKVSPISAYSARGKYEVVTNVRDVAPPDQPRPRNKRAWQVWKRSQDHGAYRSESWKPITLRAPVLGSLILFSVLIISLLEVLSAKSSGNQNGGGLVFAADVDNLPTFSSFGYLYFPTIIAVCYSLMWGWVDLDVKRLEPWFRLSTATGAKAADSLLLQYPSDFLPFVPITAFRRKHWSVFLAGTIMLTVFWAITPLQSAIFNAATITRSISTKMVTSARLISMNQQITGLNANFLNTAYAISWLGQVLPAFTTANYAVLPFQPTPERQSISSLEAWTTDADAFSTTLSCTPAHVNLTGLGYTFSNGKGCVVPQINLADTYSTGKYMVNYIGYFNNAQNDWFLQNPNCSAEFSNNFLALWASNSSWTGVGTYSNLTALFCETSYSSTRYSVTVNASNSAIVTGYEISSKGDSTIGDLFNTTAFEYILSTGVNPIDQGIDLPSRAVLEQSSRLLNYSLASPVSNVVGFAVALNPLTVEDLANATNLQNAFQIAHQLLFSTAFSSLLNSTNVSASVEDPRTGLVEETLGAIILVRPVSIAVEVALGVVAIFTAVLWYYSHRRASHLQQDPASLADVMSIYSSGRLSPATFDLGEESNKAALVKVVSNKTYHLLTNGAQPDVTAPPDYNYPRHGHSTSITSGPRAEEAPSVLPLELHRLMGFIFGLFISSSIFGVVYLNYQARRLNGLTLPSTNSIVLSILENYVPTIFATLLEPVWVVLNRQLCLLKPFDELRKGNAKSSNSLEAKYSSLPPQLSIWRAIKAGHFVLASVCLIALSTNILAVTLSTLVNERVAQVTFQTQAQQVYLPTFNDTRISNYGGGPSGANSDHFYLKLANLTHNTSLPAWLDSDYYYMPFSLETPPEVSDSVAPTIVEGFKVSTTGFGSSVNCTNLTPGTGPDTYLFNISADGSTAFLSTTHQLPNGTAVTCVPLAVTDSLNETIGFAATFPTGNLAREVMQGMFPAGGLDDGGFCASLLVAGWTRAGPTPGSTPFTGAKNSTHPITLTSSSFVACTAKLQTAQFEVYVDPSGHILSTNQTTNATTDTSRYFIGNGTELNLITEAVSLIAPFNVGLFEWHNGTFTTDWMNSLLAIMQNSDAYVNPSFPAPNGTAVAPMIEKLYTQLFGLLLSLDAAHVFPVDTTASPFPAKAIGTVPRLFLNETMFQVSVAILILHFVCAVIFYVFRPKKFLPRMPISIAAILSFVTASRALEDFKELDRGLRMGGEGGEEMRYGYGRYVGTDGKTHVGIEQARFVVPLKAKNPEVRGRKWGKFLGRKDENEPRNWI